MERTTSGSNFNLLLDVRLHPALESEARVVQSLVDYTTSEWIIMPTVHLPLEPPSGD
jgi:hypothetical protein